MILWPNLRALKNFIILKRVNCDVKDVVDYAKNNHGDYTPFEGAMFCPECENPLTISCILHYNIFILAAHL